MPGGYPVAVVTGSSTGIGRATAIALAKAGWHVVVHARGNQLALDETARMVSSFGAMAHQVLADVTEADGREALIHAAFKWQGQVDLWVNNAGADVLTTAARELDFEGKLRLLLETDLLGSVLISRMVAQRMRQQASSVPKESVHGVQVPVKPSIINVGWDQALLGMADDAGQLFCTTKAAVMAFTNSLALSVGPEVRVNCVAPGWIQTAWGHSADGYWTQRAVDESILERWGTPEEVANTICWLASPAAEFINGQCIAVNGGRRFAERHDDP
jgi:3-oxoacyl-[acyl-carrier protein] reductase